MDEWLGAFPPRQAARQKLTSRTCLIACSIIDPQAAMVDSDAPGRLDQTPDAASSISL